MPRRTYGGGVRAAQRVDDRTAPKLTRSARAFALSLNVQEPDAGANGIGLDRSNGPTGAPVDGCVKKDA